MIVVSDTSPLNYLVLLGHVDVLPRLFGQVYVPPSVLNELRHKRTPEPVKAWASKPPDWLLIRQPAGSLPGLKLDRGEADAIALAKELHADAILINDDKGRCAAEGLGLTARGTLGVIALAAEMALLSLPDTFDTLIDSNAQTSVRRPNASLSFEDGLPRAGNATSNRIPTNDQREKRDRHRPPPRARAGAARREAPPRHPGARRRRPGLPGVPACQVREPPHAPLALAIAQLAALVLPRAIL